MSTAAQAGPGASPGQPAAIAAVTVTKRFPGVLATDAVDFAVHRGEVHTILGENGAGKSTLAAMLCGLYRPDEGHIERDGKQIRLRSPRDGLAQGIGMVHQHFRLVDRFTVAENVVLGDPDQEWVLDNREIDQRVADIGDQFGLPIDPRALISNLTVGQRQRVEIVKMLYRGADVLLLDEPTAVLTPPEVEALFKTVHSMTAEGKSIVFISHKLGEVMEISDRVTVMRAGAVTGEVATADTNQRHLAELMVGHPVEIETRRGSNISGDVAFSASGLTVQDGDQTLVDDVDISVHRGEIVGIAGVSGNGQRPLARALSGVIKPSSGHVMVGGVDVTGKNPRVARRAGLSFVPEDRLGTGLVPDLSLTDNMLLTRPRGFFVDRKSARAEIETAIDDYEIKTPGTEAEARNLSGGNSQKVLLARELAGLGEPGGPQAVIVSSPTRGLDIGAAEFVRNLLHEARERGAAVLIISEDLEEVRSLSDRIAVLYRGRIALEGAADELAFEAIGMAMAGVESDSDSGEETS